MVSLVHLETGVGWGGSNALGGMIQYGSAGNDPEKNDLLK